MDQRITWFAIGAVFASLLWAILLSSLNEQLFQTFFGLSGH
jgi:arginine exporter protein ArgO